jgi:Protein of unknown function (DUF3306)
MSENFISRWSRLKLGSRSRRSHETGLRENAARSSAVATMAANEDEVAGAETAATPTFDLTRLPSIDSITASTDIRVFLQSAVPVKLTEAALRRAWVSDPAIREFIGIAENQWDFTNPTTIPGFGLLRGMYDGLSLAVQTAEVPLRSLDESSALPDTCPAVEKTRSATADSRCDPIKDRTRETQGASAPQAVDSEMSSAGSDNRRGEDAPQNSLFPRSTAPRRRRHAHGSALPR